VISTISHDFLDKLERKGPKEVISKILTFHSISNEVFCKIIIVMVHDLKNIIFKKGV
jgi:hypothetical protein